MPIFLRLIIGAVFAMGLTAAVWFVDSRRVDAVVSYDALRLARQSFAQAESLTSTARSLGVRSPRRWAVNHLKQSRGERIISLEPANVSAAASLERSNARPGERTDYDREKGVFEYERSISPGAPEGFRISVAFGYRGFLGAQSPVQNDLAIAGVFMAFLAFFLLMMVSRSHRSARFGPSEEWVSEARARLSESGAVYREFVREAREMLTSSRMMETDITGARRELGAQLSSLRELQSALGRDSAKRQAVAGALNYLQKMEKRLEEAIQKLDSALSKGAAGEEATKTFTDRVRRGTELLGEQITHLESAANPAEGASSLSKRAS